MSRKNIDKSSCEERELETIFSLAVPRKKPPEFLERKVREAVHSEWRRATAFAKPRSTRAYFAVAAALVLAVAAALMMQQRGQKLSVYESASIARITGVVTFLSDGKLTPLAGIERIEIRNGDELLTSTDSGISLALGAGRQLRLAAASHARFGVDGSVSLEAGRVYVDSGEQSGDELPIRVATALGEVRHIGTRFQVLIDEEQLRVDVREGTIAVSGEGGSNTLAQAGQSLSISRGGRASISHIEKFGERWQWVDALAPPLVIDGRSLHEVIVWAAEESGREVRFADAALERESRSTTLHGALVLSQPLDDLRKIMMTTNMQFELRDNEIFVTLQR